MSEVLNTNVVIQDLTLNTKKRQKLWGVDFEGKKGKIIQVLINSRGEEQGYKIRFPMIKIVINEEGGMGERANFEYPFYNDEVAFLDEKEELLFPDSDEIEQEKRRTQRQVSRDATVVKRLKQEGIKITELSNRFNVSRQTIHQWLKR